MNPEGIKALCRQIIAEADAIMQYTDDITATEPLENGPAELFRETRLDELEHLQSLTLALTDALSTPEEEPGGES